MRNRNDADWFGNLSYGGFEIAKCDHGYHILAPVFVINVYVSVASAKAAIDLFNARKAAA